MFTQDQIEDAISQVKSGADYPKLVQSFKRIGIESYEHIVSNGANIYHGSGGYAVNVSHSQELIHVSDVACADKLKNSLVIHQKGETTYPIFCIEAGKAGVEKWMSDLKDMTVSYLDKTGKALLVEPIPISKG
jgi:uncharacterized protein YbcV (DUF1398 family)